MAKEKTNQLGNTAPFEIAKGLEKQTPIDRLADPELHKKVLSYLLDRFRRSERYMSQFHPRWNVSEKKHQAYIALKDWEKELKAMNDKGESPHAVNLVVPYNFATTSAINTYLIHTFCGRSPILQVSSNRKEGAQASEKMEILLQYQLDRSRFIKHFYQFVNDSMMYGVGILRTQWKVQKAIRTVWRDKPNIVQGVNLGVEKTRTRENVIAYEGNEIASIDPFMFYPDPSVPMTEVARRGEFTFWLDFQGKHKLLSWQKNGDIKYVDKAPSLPVKDSSFGQGGSDNSARGLLSRGTSGSGKWADLDGRGNDVYEVIQGSVEIIPRQLGLGDENYPVKYVFMILNRGQIVQAAPLECDHDMHPVAVTEPFTMGYGFGQPGLADYLNPIQDTLSWFINSHIENVRSVLNNMLVVDPSKIEMQDLKQPGPGKIIRLKRAAYGSDITSAVRQLQVGDVTQNHVRDFELFMRIADGISSINDNRRGLQDSGGRKTATEVRTSAEAGSSRLAALARIISAQAIVDMAEQMSLNTQQFMSDTYYTRLLGEDGKEAHIAISPEMIVGDFTYPIHDGTLPIDRVAMVDVWKEIFMSVAGNPNLASRFDLVSIFEYVAQLGGAKNIKKFMLDPQSEEAIQTQVQAGNMIPLDQARGQTPGIAENPADRMLQGV